jgi:hypothetical protein
LFWQTIKYLLTGGGLQERGPRPSYHDSKLVVDKYLFYRSHCTKEFHGCDGLLFTAIGQAAGACDGVKLTAFEDSKEPGRWYRSPSHDCYPTGNSASDISKDMMMGLVLWCSVYKSSSVAHRTLKRALLRGGNMGRPLLLLSRTLMSPALMYYFWLFSKPTRKVGIFGRMLLALGHSIPQTGFRAHLQAISILVLMRQEGGLNPISRKTLEKLSSDSPQNALFLAMLDRNNECLSVLMNASIFPPDRLPSTHDYSTEYLWQRTPSENPKDWLPEKQEPAKMHTGIDFLIAAAIYLKMV